MSLPADLEFDDEGDATTDPAVLQERLYDLDQTMFRVRFESPQLAPAEQMEQLARLMEDRNKLFDRARAARAAKFKANIHDLKLSGVHLQPVVAQSGRRCTLVLQDSRLTPPTTVPGKHKKKQVWRHPWYASRREFLHQRRANIERMLADLKHKKAKSIQESAEQKKLEFELAGILRELTPE
jgi:hypothetical protein